MKIVPCLEKATIKGRVHTGSCMHTGASLASGRDSCSCSLLTFTGVGQWGYVTKTLNVIFPVSKELLLLLFITDFALLLSLSALFLFCFLPSKPLLFFFLLFYYLLSPLSLQENQRMQQKVDTMTKEVFDLQETLLWKDKHIRVWMKLGFVLKLINEE